MTGWLANPKLVRHLKSNLTRTCVYVDEAVMGLSVHTDGDGEGENPLLSTRTTIGHRPLSGYLISLLRELREGHSSWLAGR